MSRFATSVVYNLCLAVSYLHIPATFWAQTKALLPTKIVAFYHFSPILISIEAKNLSLFLGSHFC